jgi:hypothetical protein
MGDVRVVGDTIEVGGVVVATITETAGTSRRAALEEAIERGAGDYRDCDDCGALTVRGG